MVDRLIASHDSITEGMKTTKSFKWLIKRTLTIALKYLNSCNCTKAIEFLKKFATDMDILNYLLNKGIF